MLCSPWKWNMLHWGLMVKDIACRSYIIERSWMSNQWEKMQQKQQYTSPQNYTASPPLWARQQRGTCVMWCTNVPEGGVHWQVLYSRVPSQTAALSYFCPPLPPVDLEWKKDKRNWNPKLHLIIYLALKGLLHLLKKNSFKKFKLKRQAQMMRDANVFLSPFSSGRWWRAGVWREEEPRL